MDKTCNEQILPEVATSLGMEAATPYDDEPSEEETGHAALPGIHNGNILLSEGSAGDDVAADKQHMAGGAAASPAGP